MEQVITAGQSTVAQPVYLRWLAAPRVTRMAAFAIGSAALCGALVWAAYHQIFNALAIYDDEGYVMMSLAQHLDGKALYDEVFTQYGPAYYAIQRAVHGALGLPVTHDVVRWKTIVLWIISSWILGAFVARVTQSRVWGGVAALAVFLQLHRLCLEPGHPNEWCLVVTAVLLLGSSHLSTGSVLKRRAILMTNGALTAVLLFMKPNVGALAMVAHATGLVYAGVRPGTLVLRLVMTVACLVAPWALCHSVLGQWEGVLLPAVTSVGVALIAWPAIAGSLRSNRGGGSAHTELASSDAKSLGKRPAARRSSSGVARAAWIDLAVYGAAVALGSLAPAGYALGTGTSLSGLAFGLVGQHLQFGMDFFHTAPIYWPAPIGGVLLLGIALAKRPGAERARSIAFVTTVFMAVALALGIAVTTVEPVSYELDLGGASAVLVSFGPLVMWLVFSPGGGIRRQRHRPARAILAMLGCLLPLTAFPIPGTQLSMGLVPVVVALPIILCDQQARRAAAKNAAQQSWDRGLWAVLLILLVHRDLVAWWKWGQSVPLEAAGVSGLRLPAHRVEHDRELIDYLNRSSPDTFFFFSHTQNRFYFWTGIDPPTAASPTAWPCLLTPAQQEEIIQRLEHGRTLLVEWCYGKSLYPGRGQVLREFMMREYRPVAELRYWRIWEPPRNAPEKTDGGCGPCPPVVGSASTASGTAATGG